MYREKFKRFGGEYIPDLIAYLKEQISNDPGLTITVGCDSIQKRRKTIYAITIMLYNTDIRNGAHVIFFRDTVERIKDNQERLYKEALYVYDIGMFLEDELKGIYIRKDLNEYERKRYKYHLAKCNGEYSHVEPHREEFFINNLVLTDSDKINYKLVDLHVDYNPFEGNQSRNKSYFAYKAYMPWLRGLGFRTWAKPMSHGASTAADLLLKD